MATSTMSFQNFPIVLPAKSHKTLSEMLRNRQKKDTSPGSQLPLRNADHSFFYQNSAVYQRACYAPPNGSCMNGYSAPLQKPSKLASCSIAARGGNAVRYTEWFSSVATRRANARPSIPAQYMQPNVTPERVSWPLEQPAVASHYLAITLPAGVCMCPTGGTTRSGRKKKCRMCGHKTINLRHTLTSVQPALRPLISPAVYVPPQVPQPPWGDWSSSASHYSVPSVASYPCTEPMEFAALLSESDVEFDANSRTPETVRSAKSSSSTVTLTKELPELITEDPRLHQLVRRPRLSIPQNCAKSNRGNLMLSNGSPSAYELMKRSGCSSSDTDNLSDNAVDILTSQSEDDVSSSPERHFRPTPKRSRASHRRGREVNVISVGQESNGKLQAKNISKCNVNVIKIATSAHLTKNSSYFGSKDRYALKRNEHGETKQKISNQRNGAIVHSKMNPEICSERNVYRNFPTTGTENQDGIDLVHTAAVSVDEFRTTCSESLDNQHGSIKLKVKHSDCHYASNEIFPSDRLSTSARLGTSDRLSTSAVLTNGHHLPPMNIKSNTANGYVSLKYAKPPSSETILEEDEEKTSDEREDTDAYSEKSFDSSTENIDLDVSSSTSEVKSILKRPNSLDTAAENESDPEIKSLIALVLSHSSPDLRLKKSVQFSSNQGTNNEISNLRVQGSSLQDISSSESSFSQDANIVEASDVYSANASHKDVLCPSAVATNAQCKTKAVRSGHRHRSGIPIADMSVRSGYTSKDWYQIVHTNKHLSKQQKPHSAEDLLSERSNIVPEIRSKDDACLQLQSRKTHDKQSANQAMKYRSTHFNYENNWQSLTECDGKTKQRGDASLQSARSVDSKQRFGQQQRDTSLQSARSVDAKQRYVQQRSDASLPNARRVDTMRRIGKQYKRVSSTDRPIQVLPQNHQQEASESDSRLTRRPLARTNCSYQRPKQNTDNISDSLSHNNSNKSVCKIPSTKGAEKKNERNSTRKVIPKLQQLPVNLLSKQEPINGGKVPLRPVRKAPGIPTSKRRPSVPPPPPPTSNSSSLQTSSVAAPPPRFRTPLVRGDSGDPSDPSFPPPPTEPPPPPPSHNSFPRFSSQYDEHGDKYPNYSSSPPSTPPPPLPTSPPPALPSHKHSDISSHVNNPICATSGLQTFGCEASSTLSSLTLFKHKKNSSSNHTSFDEDVQNCDSKTIFPQALPIFSADNEVKTATIRGRIKPSRPSLILDLGNSDTSFSHSCATSKPCARLPNPSLTSFDPLRRPRSMSPTDGSEHIYEELGSVTPSPVEYSHIQLARRSNNLLHYTSHPSLFVDQTNLAAAPSTSDRTEKLRHTQTLPPGLGKSIFDGATKLEILEILRNAKGRILSEEDQDDDAILDVQEAVSDMYSTTREGALEATEEDQFHAFRLHVTRSSNISSNSDSSESSGLLRTDKERPSVAEVERADSGVGSETSKASKLLAAQHWPLTRVTTLSTQPVGSMLAASVGGMRDPEVPFCEDCESPLDTRVTKSGVVYAPLVCRKCARRRQERREVLTEIIETELKYGKDLRIVIDQFYRPIQIAGLLNNSQLDSIFLNVAQLLAESLQFSDQLQDAYDIAYESGDEDLLTVNVAKFFLQAGTMMDAFEYYCVRQAEASLLLQTLEKEKELFRIFLRVSQMENTLLRRMNLHSFLMVPVQRVTKYPLLLGRLHKATPPNHSSRRDCRASKEELERRLHQMNSETKESSPSKLWRRISMSVTANTSLRVPRLPFPLSTPDDAAKLQKVAAEILSWRELTIVREGRLLMLPPDSNNWTRRGRAAKMTSVYTLLVTKEQPVKSIDDLPVEDGLLMPQELAISEAALVIFKYSARPSKQSLYKEPWLLSRSVVSWDAEGDADCFEVTDLIMKDSYYFKDRDAGGTEDWFRLLQFHSLSVGNWKRRRAALPNIMISSTSNRH